MLATCTHIRAFAPDATAVMDPWLAPMKRRFAGEAYWLAGLAIENGDETTATECESFASSMSTRWNRNRLVYAGKKMLGPKAMGWVRRMTRPSADLSLVYRFHPGTRFGWWPG